MVTYLIICGVVIVAIGGMYAIGYFKGSKKAGNIDNVVKEIDTLSPLLSPVVTYLEGRLPEPLQSRAKEITGVLGDAATISENAWKNGEITPESRKEFATNAVAWGLRKLDIMPNTIESRIISSAIDIAVGLFLPKSNVAKMAVTSDGKCASQQAACTSE